MSHQPEFRIGSKLLGTIILAFLVMPIAALAQSPGEIFADVPTGNALFDATSTLYQLNITNGCASSPLQFCPSAQLARDDMAAFLVRSWSISMWNDPEAFKTQAPYNQTPYFVDVLSGDPQFAYVQKLYELGITQGTLSVTGGVAYCPNSWDNYHGPTQGSTYCTAAQGALANVQIAIFLDRTRNMIDHKCIGQYGSSEPYITVSNPDCAPNFFLSDPAAPISGTPYFSDVQPTDQWFYYVQRLGDLGAFSDAYTPAPYPNCPNCTFNESGTVTRGPMALEMVAAEALDPRVTVTFNSTIGPPSGPNYTTTLPTIAVPFNYYFQDKAYLANDVAWAQFALADSGGTYRCYGDWGRPNALDLYDSGSGVTYGLGTLQADSFCTVSLVSITDSTTDPSAVTVLLNFTFNPGFAGTYTVMSQMNYATGYGTPAWENVGTVTIQTPPSESPAPTVTLVDNTQNSGYFFVNDHFTLTVTGPSTSPGLPVSTSLNGVDYGVQGYLSSGVFIIPGQWGPSAGTYTEIWYVDGVPAGTLQFSVVPPPTATLTNIAFPDSPLFEVGQRYTFQITGPPGLAVVLNSSQNGNLAQTSFGQTNAAGTYQYSGTWGSSDVGDWTDTWFIGSLQAIGQLTFSVGLTGCN